MCDTVPTRPARAARLSYVFRTRGRIGAIRCPTLVLCGREDLVTPPDVHSELADGVAGAQLVIIEECGHLLPLEQPEQVTEILRDWLSELLNPSRSNPN